jgi:nitrogen fixation protein FixH
MGRPARQTASEDAMSRPHDPENPAAGSDYVAGGSPMTGRKVALIFAAFVLTFVVVDIFMWRQASKTFGGLVTTESFREGSKYNEKIAAAQEQNERGWAVTQELSPIVDGKATLTVRARDKAGKELSGLVVDATFSHPADARQDIKLTLRERATGEYVGVAELAPGVYNLLTALRDQGKQVFQSRNRLQLFGG